MMKYILTQQKKYILDQSKIYASEEENSLRVAEIYLSALNSRINQLRSLLVLDNYSLPFSRERMDSGRNEYCFFWFIENYSYCWHKNGEKLVSPNFTIKEIEDTTWELHLFPRGDADKEEGYISLFLFRNLVDNGPESVFLNYELSFLASDGSSFCFRKTEDEFKWGDGVGYSKFLKLNKILLPRNSDYFPEDILTVHCRIWKGEGKVQNIRQSSVRSHIIIEKHSFLHAVENFSLLQPNVKQTTEIPAHSSNGHFITSSLYFTDEMMIMIEIALTNTNKILCKCEFSLLDQSGNVIECGKYDNRYDATRKSMLSLTRDAVLDRKSEYLPDDKLSLICDCTFSSGLEFQTTVETLNKIPLAVIKKHSNYVPRKIVNITAEKLSIYPSISEDMKALYTNQCLTDVEVKTGTKSFQAHKIVLCARSPVFKAMMTNNMKEKNTDCIHVVDLEDDIVQQLLLFLYSDNIENLQWENATQLYFAADKYQIGKLKEVCSSFLLENLTTSNAVELLLLADTHSDSDLKKSVEDFILEHETQIFVSNEWETLMETNPLLAMKTMHLNFKRKSEVDFLQT